MAKEGDKKTCDCCSGTGRVNGRYEEVWVNASMVPIHSEKEKQWKDEKCTKCDGKGTLELIWGNHEK